MNPLISIIIPIYNVEPYLHQCLESVLSQSFSDFEVIGVNDKSDDDSVDVFQQFLKKDRRFKLIHHSENMGLPNARNSGIFQATGEYLFFLDSDDWISPHALEVLFRIIRQDNVDIAIGGTLKCYEDGGTARCMNHANYMEKDLHGVTVFEAPQLNWSVVSWNKLIKRDVIQKNNLYFSPEPRRFEDMLTYKWYLSGAKVSLTTDITYFYRQRSEKSANGSIMQATDISVIRDKFLAYADITSFVLKTGHFNTNYDPMHSECSLANLPRALSWGLQYLNEEYSEKNTDTESIKQLLDAYKRLYSLLPEDYIKGLPDRLKAISDFMQGKEKHTQLSKPTDASIAVLQHRPLVSVIMPVFNAAEFLNKSIDSLLFQTFQDFEVLCVDDCSKDKSLRILEQYARKDDRIKIIRHSENLRQGAARNTGIKNAKGQFLFFLDADDWLNEIALEELYSLRDKDKVDIALGGIRLYHEATGKMSEGVHSSYQNLMLRNVTPFETPQLFDNAVVCNKLVCRKFITKNDCQYFNTNLKRFEDTDMAMRWWLCKPKVSLSSQITYFYRQQPGDTPDRSNRKIGGSDYAYYYRICLLKEILDFEINRNLIGEPYGLPKLLNAIVNGIRIATRNDIDPDARDKTLCIAEEVSQKMPEEFIASLDPGYREIFSFLKQNQIDNAVSFIFKNWDKVKAAQERMKVCSITKLS